MADIVILCHMLVDTHAHLNFRKQTEEFTDHIKFDQFDDEIPQVIERAHAQGVDMIIDVGDTLEDSQVSIDLSSQHKELYSTVGIHPHAAIANRFDVSMDALEAMIRSSGEGKIVAIGEIGLDFTRAEYNIDSTYSSAEKNYKLVQEKFFLGQLELARAHGLPVVIHAREAYEEISAIINDPAWKDVRFIIHCFTATSSVVQPFIARECLIGFTGIITYPTAGELRKTVASVPLSHIVVETDSPFLAPQSVRGARNEPAHVRMVAEKIAEIKKVSFEEVARVTTKNASEFFRIKRAREDSFQA